MNEGQEKNKQERQCGCLLYIFHKKKLVLTSFQVFFKTVCLFVYTIEILKVSSV